jgi:hypothetical protein
MNKNIDEFVDKILEKHSEADVLVYYERGSLKITYGFFVWNGHNHSKTTISELRADGFEKSDIKELRDEAHRVFIVEKALGILEEKCG